MLRILALLLLATGGCAVRDDTFTPLARTVFFEVDQSLTDESIANVPIRVRLSEPAPEVVKVEYAVTGGTATVGSDVRDTDGVVVFEPFADAATITLSIIDDGIEEEEEDVLLTLRSPENASLGARIEHRLRISANKLPRVRFTASASSASEADGPQSFAVQLDALAPEDVVVRYVWSGTAEPADHGVTDSLLTIRAGQLSEQILAPITNDPTDEDDETIVLALIAQEGGVIAPGMGQHVHTIVDDDPPPAIGFTLTASAVNEGTATAMLAVSLSLASEKPITVGYAAVAGGTASAQDFMLAPGTLTFPPGTTSQQVAVTIVDDALDEAAETVLVGLVNATNATLPPATATHTLTITDNDGS